VEKKVIICDNCKKQIAEYKCCISGEDLCLNCSKVILPGREMGNKMIISLVSLRDIIGTNPDKGSYRADRVVSLKLSNAFSTAFGDDVLHDKVIKLIKEMLVIVQI